MIWPFESIEIPSTSPRFMSAEYFRKFGFESNGISGTVTVPGGGGAAAGCCAVTAREPEKYRNNVAPAITAMATETSLFTTTSMSGPADSVLRVFVALVFAFSQTQRDEFCWMILTADRHDDVLLAFVHVRHQSTGRAGIELSFPHDLAGRLIVGTQF